MKEKNPAAIRIINVVTYLIMTAVNALAVLLPINGVTPGDVSDMYPNLFAPAPFTFSIWGVIYILLGVFTLYQSGIIKKFAPEPDSAVGRIGILFALSSIFNTAWIFCWHYDLIGLALICIVGILVTLAVIFLRIQDEKLVVKLPFAVYFGWITVATIANITTFLVSIGWNGFGVPPALWTVFAIFTGLIIVVTVVITRQSPAYGIAAAWAFFGILMKHLSESGFNKMYPPIIWSAAIAVGVTLIVCLLSLFTEKGNEDHNTGNGSVY